jgi:3-deoxy-manno-octulosonate cytidylyltransferase (CMP-KDO synthetase)
MEAIGVIPARLGSTRLAAKVLADLCGKPVIQHVYERARRSKLLDDVVIACDDPRVLEAVRAFGGNAVLTSTSHPTGTDRLTEVVHDRDVRLVLNIQGDEPLVNPLMIDDLVRLMQKDRSHVMGTVVKKSDSWEDFRSPDVVKAVVARDLRVLYFSRSPIPALLQPGEFFYKHIGLYAFTKDFLFTFKSLPPSVLERAERLEQLRALEHGYAIMAVETPYETVGIDTPRDLERARELLKREGIA